MFFIMAMATVLVAAYVFKHSAEEMTYLSGSISVVSIFFALALAPWALQLLLLIFVLFSNRRTFSTAQSVADFHENTNDSIKLTYRGATYQPKAPDLEGMTQEAIVKYRGQVCKLHQTQATPTAQSFEDLQYRGCSVSSSKSQPTQVKETDLMSIPATQVPSVLLK